MNDWFMIVVTSGILGILITSLVNLFISFKTIRSHRDIASFKAYIDFYKEKIDLLRNLRSTVVKLRSPYDLFEICIDEDKDKAVDWLDEEKKRFVDTIDAYKEIRYCFTKHHRRKLDELIEQIGPFDSLFSLFMLVQKKRGKYKQYKRPSSSLSEEREMEIGLKIGEKRLDLMSEFEKTLIQSIDDELEFAADGLPDFG